MILLQGERGSAKVFTDILDNRTAAQIIQVLNQEFTELAHVRIMPDVHRGVGCVIGLTMHVHDKVCPNFVGVDIGCGMETVKLREKDINFRDLDRIIREHIPIGAEKRLFADDRASQAELYKLHCPTVATDMGGHYIGTLGGGNHFIEIDKDTATGDLYLIIHSGSRKIGRKIAEYYQKQAYDQMRHMDKPSRQNKIQEWKAEGRSREIQDLLKIENKKYAKRAEHIDPETAYCTGYLLDQYLYDMDIAQTFADLNRKAIAEDILKRAGLHAVSRFSTVHNYIDVRSKIMRKGAVDAQKDKQLLIPLNMRDGALICRGLGNPDWNESAPHGAGRLMSRTMAKENLTMQEYHNAMTGIFSTSVNPDTIDESPMAYKPMEQIIENIKPTAEIIAHIKPVYNLKAGRRETKI